MPQFWLLCLAQFLTTLVTIPVHLPVHGVDLGMTVTGAATLLTLWVVRARWVGWLLGVSLIGGAVVALMICLATLSATLSFLTVAQTATALYVFAFIYGFAHGGLFTVVSPTVAEYFGMVLTVHFGTIVLVYARSLSACSAGCLPSCNRTFEFWARSLIRGALVAFVDPKLLEHNPTPQGLNICVIR